MYFTKIRTVTIDSLHDSYSSYAIQRSYHALIILSKNPFKIHLLAILTINLCKLIHFNKNYIKYTI